MIPTSSLVLIADQCDSHSDGHSQYEKKSTKLKQF